MKLKDNLRYLRKKAGMTQADLAKKLHVRQYNISDYEIGRIEPSIETLCKMADIFHVSIDYLVGRRSKDYDEESEPMKKPTKSPKSSIEEDKYLNLIGNDIKGLDANQKRAVSDLVHFSIESLLKENG